MSKSGEFFPDNLQSGDMTIATQEVTIQSGEGVLKRGTALGQVTRNVPATGTPGGGNTGNGTMTDVQGRRKTKVGTYSLACITAIANSGVFSVTDPDGNVLANARVGNYAGTGNGTILAKAGRNIKDGLYRVVCTVAAANAATFQVIDPDGTVLGTLSFSGAGAVGKFENDQINIEVTDGATDFAVNDEFQIAPYESDQLAFALTDGATDFVVGDTFAVAVVVGSYECRKLDSDHSDGSQNPFAILLDDEVDASTAAKKGASAISGQFNERAVIFGGNDTPETHRTAFRDIGIYLEDSQQALPNA